MAPNSNGGNDITAPAGSSSDDESERQHLRKEYETHILWEFRNAFQNCHEWLLYDENSHLLTEEEHQYLESLYSDPTLYCLAAGLGTLVMLRMGRRALRNRRQVRQLRQQQQQQNPFGHQGGYTMDVPPPAQLPPSTPTPSRLRRFATFGMEFTVCFLAGAVTGTYLVNIEESGMEKIPLAAGRSGIADQFCPVLQEEFKEQWKLAHRVGQFDDDTGTSHTATIMDLGILGSLKVTAHDEYIPAKEHQDVLQRPNDKNLQAYIAFVHNCRKRQAMERRLRREQSLVLDPYQATSVSIPPPGVVLTSAEEEEEEDVAKWVMEGDATANGGQAEFWSQEKVASWVSDQEDDNQRRK